MVAFDPTVVLGGLTPQQFLDEYWQQKPLLIRNAFPSFTTPDGLNQLVDGNELAGLACDADAESRLILEHGVTPWELRNGPFDESVFSTLPPSHWTMLVQDVEKHIPELADIFDAFRFIPSWRMDDLMISYAEDGGSVGPHTDAYDVFLLQAHGQRHWQIQSDVTEVWREDTQLRILQHFSPEQEWTLAPGDMLYVPPHVAHHGVAQGECITWSIGFRAPSYADMVNDYADMLVQQLADKQRYDDAQMTAAPVSNGQIDDAAVQRVTDIMTPLLNLRPEVVIPWWGCVVTSPKPWLSCDPLEDELSAQQLLANMSQTRLYRDTRALLAWYANDEHCWLFVDGESVSLPLSAQPLLPLLTQERELDRLAILDCLQDDEALSLLLALLNAGQLYFDQ